MSRSSVPRVLVCTAALALLAAAPVTASLAQAARADLDESWWAVAGPDGVQRVNIRCGANYIDPRSIVVRANVPLQLSVSAPKEVVSHQFSMTMGSASIDAPVDAAQRTFLVSPKLTGRFETLCHDISKAESAAARKAKTGSITVIR